MAHGSILHRRRRRSPRGERRADWNRTRTVFLRPLAHPQLQRPDERPPHAGHHRDSERGRHLFGQPRKTGGAWRLRARRHQRRAVAVESKLFLEHGESRCGHSPGGANHPRSPAHRSPRPGWSSHRGNQRAAGGSIQVIVRPTRPATTDAPAGRPFHLGKPGESAATFDCAETEPAENRPRECVWLPGLLTSYRRKPTSLSRGLAEASDAALEESRSRPKAFRVTAPIIRDQTAKNSDPASERKESLIMEFLRQKTLRPRQRVLRGDKLLLGRLRARLIPVLLDTRLAVGLHLLQLRLLVRSEHLVHFVVYARFLDGELRLDLRFLRGQRPHLGLIEVAFGVLTELEIDLVLPLDQR